MSKLQRMLVACGVAALTVGLLAPTAAVANQKLIELSKDPHNWVMPGKNYHSNNYSTLDQVNTSNVDELNVAWTFSTGVLSGHEGTPLVVNGMMYINTPFPNKIFALDLDNPSKIVWQYQPNQDPAARAVACCDVVNRGLAYYPGGGEGPAGTVPPLIIGTQLEGNLVALNAKTGELYWLLRVLDISVGATITQAPYVVKDMAIVGSSGAELGVRGVITAFDIGTGKMVWRAYATGPDEDLRLADDFNAANPHYGRFGLGLKTWEGQAWKIGGGTNWGWYAYDPELEYLYYGSGNPAPWNETMRPGDNKWTMTIWARNVNNGRAKFGYQKTPHDEWDYAGVNVMILSEQKINGEMTKLLTHPDRNGFIYTLNRVNGDLVRVDKLDPTVNWAVRVDMETGLPIRNPEFGTHMGHKTTGICPSAMGYHNQGHDSYDPKKNLFYLGINHLCMDWEPYMLPYRAGQFFVGANVWSYPGPKGEKEKGVGSGQIKAYSVQKGEYVWSFMERFSVWGGTAVTAGDLVFYGTLDGFLKARNSDTGKLLWKFKLPSGVVGNPMVYKHNGTEYIAIYYGVGGWPAVGLVFDIDDPTGGLGAVNAFKKLRTYTKMGGGVFVFSLDGKGPYDDPMFNQYQPPSS